MKKGARALKMLDKIFNIFEKAITIFTFFLMFVIVLYGIVMRFIFRLPNPYGEEIARYSMIFFIYIGASINVREKGHLAVEMIVDILPMKIRKICMVIADIISVAGFGLCSYLAIVFIQQMLKINQNSSQMGIPMWIIFMSMAVGFCLSFIRSIMLFVNDYLMKEKPLLRVSEVEEYLL